MKIKTIEKTLPAAKTVLSLATGVGAGRIIGGIVDMVAPQASIYGKVTVYIAKVGIASAVGAAVDENNNKNIDAIFAAVKGFTTPKKSA